MNAHLPMVFSRLVSLSEECGPFRGRFYREMLRQRRGNEVGQHLSAIRNIRQAQIRHIIKGSACEGWFGHPQKKKNLSENHHS